VRTGNNIEPLSESDRVIRSIVSRMLAPDHALWNKIIEWRGGFLYVPFVADKIEGIAVEYSADRYLFVGYYFEDFATALAAKFVNERTPDGRG
jgi:hypothetical protein